MSASAAPVRSTDRYARQTAIGLGLAAAVVAGWLALHVLAVFVLPWHVALALAPPLLALQCWLSVGLFIVAHDAMHGSLAPFRPAVNRGVGRLVLMLYAGIWYDALVSRHFAHHRAPGTAEDPDFSGDGHVGFWRWFGAFFAEYLSPGQIARLMAGSAVYLLVLGVPTERLLLFWALPAILSAFQLFFFGTYLPHRAEEEGFHDDHRARSNDFSWLLSLLTCFHFGYHHEHHDDPSVPWWRLPTLRRLPAMRGGEARP
ncbi:fatty acid desaturase [Lichenibacterium ramalinae]|uniref:Beta-carotene ketolase n=1 Tax=Lichenibacterium ramalinae TaxID=2316527 RepID=A0A4Q2R4M5_9HYPH|nr:fatty acid desaturase [Lichenibacterium ramalinae]RYB01496.1 beta-carotene ketolase [Lichenibacterium ramalinae]